MQCELGPKTRTLSKIHLCIWAKYDVFDKSGKPEASFPVSLDRDISVSGFSGFMPHMIDDTVGEINLY